MDSLEQARAIKQDPALVGTRLVMLSSVEQRSEMDLMRAGIEEALVKPVKQSRFYDCLAAVLNRSPTRPAVLERPPIVRADTQPAHQLTAILLAAMTANAMQGDRERCFASGMDDYLSKPVRAPELLAALERWKQTVKIRSRERPFSAGKPENHK